MSEKGHGVQINQAPKKNNTGWRRIRNIGLTILALLPGAGGCIQQIEPTGIVAPAVITKDPLVVGETQTAAAPTPTERPTDPPIIEPTQAPTETPEPTPAAAINPTKEAEWVAAGFLPDYTKNGEVLSYKTENINGTEVELVGFRVGQTEIWVDKNLVNLEADFGLGGTKYAGETIIPDPNSSEAAAHIAKIGAFVHAPNLGLVEKYGDNWYQEYVKHIEEHPDASYVLKGQAPMPGNPETYSLQDIGTVDASKPIRFVFLEPKMEKSEAMDRPDRIMGGDSRAPFKLQYATQSQGYYGITIDNGELKILTSEFLFDGKLLSMKVCGPEIYSLAEIGGIESYRDRLVSFQSTPQWFKDSLYKEVWAKPKLEEPYLVWAQK